MKPTRKPTTPREKCGLGWTLVAFSLLAGCESPEKAKFDVGERRLLLVPFRDLTGRYGHGYGESERGTKVIDAFRNWTEKNFEPSFTDPRSTEAVVRELREWTRESFTPLDWRQILGGIDADLVLVGDILVLETSDPKSIGFLRGRLEGRYSLIKALSGREVYRSTPIRLEYPPPREMERVLYEFGTKPEEIERALLRLLGEKVGKDLYGYYGGRD